MAALRSSNSVMLEPGPVLAWHGTVTGSRWHSMLPSANRPRDQQPGRHVGREQAAAGGQDDAVADPLARTPNRRARPPRRRPRRRSVHRARVRSASAHASSARGAGSSCSAPASADVAGARRRRCSARACARSTSAGRRCARARRSRFPGTRLRSNRGGCGGTPRRASPSSRPRTTRGRPRASSSSARRYASAWRSSSGAAAPAATRRPSGVAGSTVSAYALTCGYAERDRALERGAPVVDASRPACRR